MFDLTLFCNIWVRSGDLVEFLDHRNHIVRAAVVLPDDGKLEVMSADVQPMPQYLNFGHPCTILVEPCHIKKIWLVKPAAEAVPYGSDDRLRHGEHVMFHKGSACLDGIVYCSMDGFAIVQPDNLNPGQAMVYGRASIFQKVAQLSKTL